MFKNSAVAFHKAPQVAGSEVYSAPLKDKTIANAF